MVVRRVHLSGRLLASVLALVLLGLGPVAAPSQGAPRPAPQPVAAARQRSNAPVKLGSAATTLHGDINGDGYSDLAVGIVGKTVNGAVAAGAVSVIFGSPDGLTSDRNQLFTQDSQGMLDQAESGDQWGRYVGGGDFNGDGFFDLAIGAPQEDLDTPSGTLLDAGAVQIVFGSSHGLSARGNELLTQMDLNNPEGAEAGDWFGGRMQGGDFNGDGFDDLAVGDFFEDVPKSGGREAHEAGSVTIYYGGTDGLVQTSGVQYWTQDTPGMLDSSEPGDYFGRALGSGDFNGDGFADLAIGVRGEKVNGQPKAGACQVLYGSPAGLIVTGNQLWTQDSPGIKDKAEPSDWLGRTGVTAGDFNNDGFDDLAVGALQDSVSGQRYAGVVNVIFGSPAGLTADGNEAFNENVAGSATDGAENGDRFGRTVEAADFNCDGFSDLAIGISDEDVGTVILAGAAQVLYGGPTGLTEAGNQWWNQDSPGILDQAEKADSFDGRVPDVGDNNGDGCWDLSVGVFKEDLELASGTIADAGAVNVIYGSPGVGLTATGNQLWSEDSPGILGDPETRDSFGQSTTG